MPDLIYRNATQNDLSRIVEIYNSTIPLRTVTADTETVSVESRQKWFDEHSPDKRPLWVVENGDNQIIGWVSFQSFYGRPAYDATVEISIYLDPAQRGQRIRKRNLTVLYRRSSVIWRKNITRIYFCPQ